MPTPPSSTSDTGENKLFTPGAFFGDPPKGDPVRQAVASLRGYAYQIAVSALAWIDLQENDRIFLEVAEDYATVARDALQAIQARDTVASGTVTLNTPGIRDAVGAFVDLVARNPGRRVVVRYLTTSPIGTEHRVDDRPAGEPGLAYWRKAASGADVAPLRAILLRETFPEAVRNFVSERDDVGLRRDLLQNIHWDCGAPDLTMIRRELEERLVVVGRDKFNIPADEARRLVDTLMNAVLQTSIQTPAEERTLSRSTFYATIDSATRLSMPRSSVDTLERLSSMLSGAMAGGYENGNFSLTEFSWIAAGQDLSALSNYVPRPSLSAAIEVALQANGVAIVFGGSGLGKTLVARTVARARSVSFDSLDFRDLSVGETCHRLNFLFARLGAFTSSVMIFDDLNHLEDSRVTLALARVLSALRRRDRSALFTCYRKPSTRSLVEMGLNITTLVEATYFSESEVGDMVSRHGGDHRVWARIAYVAGAQGHPQLVHAFVLGMASRGWPTSELSEVIVRGLSSDEIDAERDAARRRLQAALPEGTRDLLYRLSLVIGSFDRALALSIGSHAPAISRAGERLDELIGPWVEPIARDVYRVSPLARQAGLSSFMASEQAQIHAFIAKQLLSRRAIDVSRASMILGHALAGKAEDCLLVIADSVMRASQEALTLLSENFTLLRVLGADNLIYPENVFLSRILRLAQFRLLAASGDDAAIGACATALLREIAADPDPRLREHFEAVALSTMLFNLGSANYLPEWMALLRRFRTLVESNKDLQEFKLNVETMPDNEGIGFYGMIFSVGTSRISSIERFEQIIIDLDGLEPSERGIWLEAYQGQPDGFGLFANGPWSAEHQRDVVDAADAEQRYKRIIERTRGWGMRSLTIACYVARSVILDEYARDKIEALAAIDEGVATLGDDVAFERERAKIHWRDGDYFSALAIMRCIADAVGRDNPIERAFAMREAAISAAKTGDWAQAETWFIEGLDSASLVSTEDMQAMAVGLRADAAVAAYHAGSPERLLRGLAAALSALKDLAPDVTLRAAYCHRVTRHAVLWAKSLFAEHDVTVNGKPILMLPGTCSNPEPLPAIREQPLAPIDLAWYMLAEAEVEANVNSGVFSSLHERLVNGPIPVCDVTLRGCLVIKDVRELNAVGLAEHIIPFIEAIAFIRKQTDALQSSWTALDPARGEIPSLSEGDFGDDLIEPIVTDVVLAFCGSAVLLGKSEMIDAVEATLVAKLGPGFHGSSVFNYWRGSASTMLSHLDRAVAKSIHLLREDDHIEPRSIWYIGLRFYEKSGQSNFKGVLVPRIAAWLRGEWTRIVAVESFRLNRPAQTVPAIEKALLHRGDDETFLARLLLSTSEAVNVNLSAAYREHLACV